MITPFTNENNVLYWQVKQTSDGPIMGNIYSTSHPTIPFEAFRYGYEKQTESHRCYSLEEGEKFILKTP